MQQEVIYKKDPNEEFLIPINQIAYLKKEKEDKGAVQIHLTCHARIRLDGREATKLWNYFKEEAINI